MGTSCSRLFARDGSLGGKSTILLCLDGVESHGALAGKRGYFEKIEFCGGMIKYER